MSAQYRPVMNRPTVEEMISLMSEPSNILSPCDALEKLMDKYQSGERIKPIAPVEAAPPESQGAPDPTPSPQALGSTLDWFTSKVDALESEIEALRAQVVEKDKAIEALRQEREAATMEPAPLRPASIPLSGSAAIADQVIEGLIRYNDSQQDPLRKIGISMPAVKSLCALFGAAGQATIQNALQRNREDIDDCLSRHMLGQRHNRKLSQEKRTEIIRDIARDFLGAENWEDGEYDPM